MAKAKKVQEPSETSEEVQPENTELNTVEEANTEHEVVEEKAEEYIYVPDIPAQMIEKPDTDEIVFLRRILQIQEEGCFGRHLNILINDRIKQLKS